MLGLIFASAESGAPGVAFSFIHLHTIYRLYPQSSILGSTSTLSCAASAETLRTQCGVSRRSGGDCGVRPAGPASTQLLCVLSSVFYDLTPTQHTYTSVRSPHARCKAHSPRRHRHSGVSSAVGLCRPWSHTALLLSHARRHPHTAALTHRPHTRCPRTRCPYASP